MGSPTPRPLTERFWEKVQICEHGWSCIYCCWPWLGSCNDKGYGQFAMKINGKWKPQNASRIAWEFFNQKILPQGKWILHHCDFRPCCSPMHLYPGTAKQNTQDAVTRGRFVGRYHGKPRRGSQVPGTHLMEKDVEVIRALYGSGMSMQAIATEFGIQSPAVHAIIHGRSWKHVPLPSYDPMVVAQSHQIRGETHPLAKLTTEQVQMIRALHTNGVTVPTLARQFAVTRTNIRAIIQRRLWTHIP